MRAVRLYEKGVLRVEEVSPPAPPEPGWASLKVIMAGICGSDIHNFKTGQWITRSPSVAGHEFTGVVTALGAGVENIEVGDMIVADSRFWCGHCGACKLGQNHLCQTLGFIGEACDGCFAELVNLPAKLLHKIPSGLAPQIAAMAEPFAVALHAINRLRLMPHEPVLIVGCGPIGGLAAVILAHQHVGPILVVDRNAARAESVAQVTNAQVATLDAEHIKGILQGRKLTAAIDATGSIQALQALLNCVPSGANIALVGISHGKLEFDPNVLVERELALIGCHAFQNEMPAAISLLPACANMIDQLIDREITLDDVPAAYARIAANQVSGLKTLIRI